MKLLAVVRNPVSIARYLKAAGEPTDAPSRSPNRGPPYWKSRVLRRQALGHEDDCRSHTATVMKPLRSEHGAGCDRLRPRGGVASAPRRP